ncbi:MAG: hypothetical protein EOP24_30370 [Hyphomicrobiales bacterium]|nr:MAG: hypothetical protein EOP24_30370 [Hyphomicrobiales bacterium]
MATQIDSPDGKTHKDPDRPSPAFVETDDRPGKETTDTLRPPGSAGNEAGQGGADRAQPTRRVEL